MDVINQNIGGKDYKFRYNMKAFARWQRAEGLTLADLGDMSKIDLMHMANLFRFASEEGGQPLTLDEVFSLMEYPGALSEMSDAMQSKMMQFLGDEGDEKKTTP